MAVLAHGLLPVRGAVLAALVVDASPRRSPSRSCRPCPRSGRCRWPSDLSISSQAPWPTSPTHMSPVSRSNEKRQGLRQPMDQISSRPAGSPQKGLSDGMRVGGAAGRIPRVDAQHLAQEAARGSGRAPPGRRHSPPSPMPMYSISSGPNAIMPPLWLLYGWEILMTWRRQLTQALVRVAGQAPRLRDHGRAIGLAGVVDVEQMVRGVVGMEREPEQALLAALGDLAPDVEERADLLPAVVRTWRS